MLFLQEHRVSINLAVKIYRTYGEDSLEVVKNNPYQLEQDIYGVGFRTADGIAKNLGLPVDHPSRIEAGIIYVLSEITDEGHVFIPEGELLDRAIDLLSCDQTMVKSAIERLVAIDRVTKDIFPEEFEKIESKDFTQDDPDIKNSIVYLTPFYFSECGLAQKLRALNNYPISPWQAPLLSLIHI